MRRIKLVVGVAAVMAAILVASAAPAMARDFDFNGGGGGTHIVSSHNVGGEVEIDGNSLDLDGDFLSFGDFLVFGGVDAFEWGDFDQSADTGGIGQSFTS